MKNVWIEGAVTPFGERLAHAVVKVAGVERVVGVEPEARPDWDPRIEWLHVEPDHRGQLELMREYAIDTVIQCSPRTLCIITRNMNAACPLPWPLICRI